MLITQLEMSNIIASSFTCSDKTLRVSNSASSSCFKPKSSSCNSSRLTFACGYKANPIALATSFLEKIFVIMFVDLHIKLCALKALGKIIIR